MSVVSELGLGAQGRSLQNQRTAWPPPQPVIPGQALRSFSCQREHTPVLSALPLVSPRKFGTRLRSSLSSSLSFWCKASLIRPTQVPPSTSSPPPAPPSRPLAPAWLWLWAQNKVEFLLSSHSLPPPPWGLGRSLHSKEELCPLQVEERKYCLWGPRLCGAQNHPQHLAQPWLIVDS